MSDYTTVVVPTEDGQSNVEKGRPGETKVDAIPVQFYKKEYESGMLFYNLHVIN